MTPADRDRYIGQILIDALTIQARLHAAVHHLTETAGGYSANASGSNNGPSGNQELTVTEAAANAHLEGRTDQASDTLTRLDHELTEAANHLHITARATTANWIPCSESGRAADAITRRIDDLWCSNHRKHKVWEPRGTDSTLCAWCADTKKPVKDGGMGHLPDAELIEARHRRGRLTTRDYDQFVQRQRSQMSQRKQVSRQKRKGAA